MALVPEGAPTNIQESSTHDQRLSFAQRMRSSLSILLGKVGYTQRGQDKEQPTGFEGKYGLYTESGQPILEAPNPRQIEGLSKNPRIEYFPFQIPKEEETVIIGSEVGVVFIPNQSKVLGNNLVTLPLDEETLKEVRKMRGGIEKFFAEYVTNFLVSHMKDQFGDNFLVGLRGTTCSIDGTIDIENFHVMDIEEVLMKGNERVEHREAPMTGFGNDSEEIHYRTHQYLVSSAQSLRERLADHPDQATKVFPVLLVYDHRQMKFEEKGVYGKRSLPDEPEQAAKAIIKAYVLDYPSVGY